MSEALVSHLREPVTAHRAFEHAWRHAKAMMMAGHRMVLELKPETRSGKQNRLLHAMLRDVAMQVEWAGGKRDTETWKRLMTAAWLRARGESVEILPAIDGHGIDVVFRRTSQLTKTECVELCDFVQAWAAEHGVEFSGESIDPETGEILSE